MGWSWITFIVCTIVFYIGGAYVGGQKNAERVAKYGDIADYRKNSGAAVVGQLIAAAAVAAVVAVIVGTIL